MGDFDEVTHWALRAGLNNLTDVVLENGEDNLSRIQAKVMQHVSRFLDGKYDARQLTQMLTEQQTIVGAALGVLGIAFNVAQQQLSRMNQTRLIFDSYREAGIGFFSLRKDVVVSSYSPEEKKVYSFERAMARYPAVAALLGSKSIETENETVKLVFPLFRTTEGLSPFSQGNGSLGQERTGISLFCRAVTNNKIAVADNRFVAGGGISGFFASALQGENYLKDIELSRFMAMKLANLLWNLQHLVDPSTGLPLGSEDCVARCEDAILALQQFLTDKDAFPKKDNSAFKQSVLQVIGHISNLSQAYQESANQDFDFESIMNSARRALYTMNKSIFGLIYSQADSSDTQIPLKETIAESIAYNIGRMSVLIERDVSHRNNTLMGLLQPYQADMPVFPLVNKPASTVIDVLALCCWLPSNTHDALVRTLQLNKQNEFATVLADFRRDFIRPIRKYFAQRSRKSWDKAVTRLLPLFTLLVQNYKYGLSSSDIVAKEQVQSINQYAADSEVYIWSLRLFLIGHGVATTSGDSSPKGDFDVLLTGQYRMSLIASLLASLHEIKEKYQNFLQDDRFQRFLIDCLKKIDSEYNHFSKLVEQLQGQLNAGSMSLELQLTFGKMLKELKPSLKSLAQGSSSAAGYLSVPGFTAQKKRELDLKLSSVANQFTALYGPHAELDAILEDASIRSSKDTERGSSEIRTLTPGIIISSPKESIALYKLIDGCYNAMSAASRIGHKGELMRGLLEMVEERETPFTDGDLSDIILALARVVSSYRTTWIWIFQASYAYTQSAQAFVKLLRDPQFNRKLPLAKILFNNAMLDLSRQSEETIFDQLDGLRLSHGWEECESGIDFSGLFQNTVYQEPDSDSLDVYCHDDHSHDDHDFALHFSLERMEEDNMALEPIANFRINELNGHAASLSVSDMSVFCKPGLTRARSFSRLDESPNSSNDGNKKTSLDDLGMLVLSRQKTGSSNEGIPKVLTWTSK